MKKFLIPVLAAAALVGCTKENQGVTYADNEILASATTLSVDAVTKAPVEGYGSGFLARVPISETSGDYTNEYGEAAYMNFASEDTEVGFVKEDGTNPAAKFYPASGTVYLSGLYPAKDWTLKTTANTTTAQFTFDGSDDVMAAKEVTSTKEEAADGTYKTLAFEHLLTQITVKFNAATENDAEAWGNIASLELLSSTGAVLGNLATVTLKDGSATFSGSGSASFYAVNGGTYSDAPYASTEVPVNNMTAVAYIMCAPVEATNALESAEYQLKITTDGGQSETVDINLKANGDAADFADNTAGYAFNVELTFKATEIKAMASIAEWKDGGTTTVTVGE